MDKRINTKLSNLTPSNMKENNMNIVNIFDTSLKSKKERINGFEIATKLKRNFK